MKKILFVFFAFYCASAYGVSFSNSGGGDWPLERAVEITNSGSSLQNYQMKITFSTSGANSLESDFFKKTKTDGSDLRFADSSGEELSFWMEKWKDSGESVFWLKIPSLPAGTTRFYVYYGNPDAAGSGDIEKVFDFVDDFDAAGLDTDKWEVKKENGFEYQQDNGFLVLKGTASADLNWGGEEVSSGKKFVPPFAVDVRIKVIGFNSPSRGGIVISTAPDGGEFIRWGWYIDGNTGKVNRLNLSNGVSRTSANEFETGRFYDYRIEVDENWQWSFYFEGEKQFSESFSMSSSPAVGLEILTDNSGTYCETGFDDLRVSGFSSTPPTYLWGQEKVSPVVGLTSEVSVTTSTLPSATNFIYVAEVSSVSPPETVLRANNVAGGLSEFAPVGKVYKIAPYDVYHNTVAVTSPVEISIKYSADASGFVAGTYIKEETLKAFHLNESLSRWEAIENSSVDDTAKVVKFATKDFSYFTLMGYTASSTDKIGEVKNFPNPFDPFAENTSIIYTLDEDSRVEIKIYNLVGDLIREIACEASSTGGSAGSNLVEWDGKNSSGMIVASGTYFARVIVKPSSGGEVIRTRKITVVK